jgi:hypothetical protein
MCHNIVCVFVTSQKGFLEYFRDCTITKKAPRDAQLQSHKDAHNNYVYLFARGSTTPRLTRIEPVPFNTDAFYARLIVMHTVN